MVWTKGRDIPVLAQTFNGNTPIDQFGGGMFGETLRGGGRVTLGLWLDDCDSIGIGTRFLGVQGDRIDYARASDANSFPTILRPFFNTDPDPNRFGPDALIVSLPGLSTGSIDIRTSNDVYSSDTFLRVNMLRDSQTRWDLIGGYHFTLVDDGLTVHNRSTITGGQNPVGTIFDFRDAFNARNEFHGGSIGVMGQRTHGCWTMNLLAKLSVGRSYQSVTIDGQTTVIDVGGGVATTAGGLLTQPTNIGNYQRTKTVFVPEAALSLNRRITDNWDVSIGYSFIGWSSVLLAGDQIDRSVNNTATVNGSQLNGGALNGPANPRFAFTDTSFWLNAMSFGVNYRY